jgi:hypothetical protein
MIKSRLPNGIKKNSADEWLIKEVNAAREEFNRLPEWKKELLRFNDLRSRDHQKEMRSRAI